MINGSHAYKTGAIGMAAAGRTTGVVAAETSCVTGLRYSEPVSTGAVWKDTRRPVNSLCAATSRFPLDAGSAARLVRLIPQDRPRNLHPGLRAGPIYGSAACLNLSVRDEQFGDYVPDGVSKWLPCVGSLHPQRMESAHGKVRAEGNSKISGE